MAPSLGEASGTGSINTPIMGVKEELFGMINDRMVRQTYLRHKGHAKAYGRVFHRERVCSARGAPRSVGGAKRYGLEGYVKNDELVVLDEMQPFFYRENNPPMFPKEQDEDFVAWKKRWRARSRRKRS